jgi:hypothetical protein
MHDGAPANFSYSARDYLETACTGRWMEKQGPESWPSHLPDLNLFIFSYGDIKKI